MVILEEFSMKRSVVRLHSHANVFRELRGLAV